MPKFMFIQPELHIATIFNISVHDDFSEPQYASQIVEALAYNSLLACCWKLMHASCLAFLTARSFLCCCQLLVHMSNCILTTEKFLRNCSIYLSTLKCKLVSVKGNSSVSSNCKTNHWNVTVCLEKHCRILHLIIESTLLHAHTKDVH